MPDGKPNIDATEADTPFFVQPPSGHAQFVNAGKRP